MRRSPAFIALLFLLSAPGIFSQAGGAAEAAQRLDPNLTAGRQYALLIAVDRYRNWPALETAVKEAQALKEILAERYCFDEIIELYDQAAGRTAFLRRFEELKRRLQTGDSVLIYCGGRGYFDQPGGSSYWIPENGAALTNAPSEWLPHALFRDLIASLPAVHVLLISDPYVSTALLEPSPAKTKETGREYLRRAYARFSRQALSAPAVETEEAAGPSEFSRALQESLRRNANPWFDALALSNDLKKRLPNTPPVFGGLKEAGHQEGASFLFFLKPESKPEPEKTAFVLPPAAPGEFRDEFDSDRLKEGWEWVRENPTKWSLKTRAGELSISTEAGDLYGKENNCRNLLLRDPGLKNFTLETRVEFSPSIPWHQAGIVIIENDNDYVSTVFGFPAWEGTDPKASQTCKVGLVNEIYGFTMRKTAVHAAGTVFLRLTKVGDRFTAYYSDDGQTFTAIGLDNAHFPGRIRVGLFAYAGNETDNRYTPRNMAYFEYFRLLPVE